MDKSKLAALLLFVLLAVIYLLVDKGGGSGTFGQGPTPHE